MDFLAMWNTMAFLKERSGKSRLWLFCDMLRCALKFNAGYMDYKIAQMYQLSDEQKETQITRGLSNAIVRRMNDKAYWHYFDDKAVFNELFSEEVNRRWLKLDGSTSTEDLKTFLLQNDVVIIKPLEGSSGKGIECHTKEEWADGGELFGRYLMERQPLILEERVVQHSRMAELCPASVNTVRIATLLGERKQGIVYAFLRIGNGKVVDNVDCGGMAARVDLQTGRLLTVGADKQGNTFTQHPITGTPIVGFEIPFFQEAMDMCLQAAQKIPQMRFIAWDVAITVDGPLLIEGNSFPSHAVPQFAAHYPDGIGIMREFREFISI